MMYYASNHSSLQTLKNDFDSAELFEQHSCYIDRTYRTLFGFRVVETFLSTGKLVKFLWKDKNLRADLTEILKQLIRSVKDLVKHYHPRRIARNLRNVRSLPRYFRIHGKPASVLGVTTRVPIGLLKVCLRFLLCLAYAAVPIMIVLLPLLLATGVLLGMVKVVITRFIKLRKTLGQFSSQKTSRDCTIFFDFKAGVRKANYQATISHEHMHIVQNDHVTQHEGASGLHDYPTPCLFGVFTGDNIDAFMNYLMDRFELEVRLHEMVCAFYQRRGFLPENNEQFWDLVRCHVLINSNEILGPKQDSSQLFIIKNYKSNYELLYIFKSIDKSLHARFVHEVLYRMYCNLLNYYKMDVLYQKAAKQVAYPSLYDRVYHITAA
ncbi:hypothetical protein K0504_04610 [Neiella marina]|uniref:Uncharacterized protein n=1 Tax=Neiella holothuriorum TaxID=2870530 RepID=A0ABS7ED86_9GAMM|nr:hypothetical protein [Neiella holothuriorum]MBW8190311.1 hypothetical protein [Neiella holothuriorum]